MQFANKKLMEITNSHVSTLTILTIFPRRQRDLYVVLPLASCLIINDGYFNILKLYSYCNTVKFSFFSRIHSKLVSTYESASVRRYRHGRVDNIRACTMEALEWCQVMIGEKEATVSNTELYIF